MFTYLLFLSVSYVPLNIIGTWDAKARRKGMRIQSIVQRQNNSPKFGVTGKTESCI